MKRNAIIDDNEYFDNFYIDFLYFSPDIEKVIVRINENLYIKYPTIKNRNKKIIELKKETRILLQDEINWLLTDIDTIKKLPFFVKILNKLKFIYRNIGQYKIILNIKNMEYKIFFIGIKVYNFNSQYCKYRHEAMPDNYKIINGEDILSKKEIWKIIKAK